MNEARYRAAEKRLWDSVGVAPTEQQLQLERTNSTVRVQEVGEGPPVVFVHGASNSGTSWAPLVARLEGFRCVLIDRPGCGLSAPLATSLADVDRLGAFGDALIVDVLDALELERAHVIGTSFGGYFALRTAAAHPDRVDHTMTFSWSVGAPMSKAPFVMRLTAVPGLGKLAASMPPNARVVRMIFRQIGLGQALKAGRISQEALDWFLALLRDTRSLRNELDSLPPLLSSSVG